MAGGNPTNDVSLFARVSRGLPAKIIDSLNAFVRSGAYGEPIVQLLGARDLTLADEGSEFQASSPTPGTGIAEGNTTTAFVTTTPYLLIQNAALAGPLAKSLYLKKIKLSTTLAGVGLATLQYVMVVDQISRWSAGGSGCGLATNLATLNGPFQANPAAQFGSIAQVFTGAVTATAPSPNARMLSHAQLRAAIPVIGDSFTFSFGGTEDYHTGLAKNGTAPSDFVVPHPTVVVPPGCSFLLYIWAAAMSTSPAFEVDACWIER